MKRVAIVTPFGAEERLDRFPEFVLVKGLKERGFDARLFTYHLRSHPGYRQDGVYQGVPTIRCSQLWGFSPKLMWRLFRFHPELIVLGHVRSYLNIGAYWVARFIGARVLFQPTGFLHDPFLVQDRDNPLETLYAHPILLTRFFDVIRHGIGTGRFFSAWQNYAFHAPLFRADLRIVLSAFERDMLRQIAGLESAVVPCGVPSRVENKAIPPRAQDHQALPDRFFFFIGQVKKRKGWDTALQALAFLKDRGIRRELVFATSSNIITAQEAIDEADRLGVRDQVWFLFSISNEEKTWLYTHAEATLTPSRYEGFGLPVVESWVAGTPVLGTDIPVYQEFLLDGITGLVSKKGDPESLAQNMLRLEDSGLRGRIVAGGYRKMLDYTDVSVVDKFLAILE